MSISRDEFEKGKKKDPLEEKIVDFLEKNKDEAFNGREIAKSVGIKVMDVKNEDWKTNAVRLLGEVSFYNVLDKLAWEGQIIKKKINYEDYYSI